MVRTAWVLLLLIASAKADTVSIRVPTVPQKVGNVEWVAPASRMPKVALVLSGGGARGFAHLGVLRAWEELQLPMDALVGTSIGGTLGGLYAAGYSADSLVKIALNTNWTELFASGPPRRNLFLSRRHEKDEALIELRFDGWKPRIPTALTTGQELTHFITDLTRAADYRIDGDFDRLTPPLRVVSVDIVTGDRVVIGTGHMADALRSTVAVPLAFTPWENEGRLLVDGGLRDPIPVDVAIELGAEIVVAVDVTFPLQSREKLTGAMALANQATSIMVLERQQQQLGLAHFVIRPSLDSLSNSDFSSLESSISRGYEAAWPVLSKLREQLDHVPPDTTAHPEWVITESVPDSITWVPPGTRVTAQSLEARLSEALAPGHYSHLEAQVVSHSDSAVLHWNARPLPPVYSTAVTGSTLLPDSQLSAIARKLAGPTLSGRDLTVATDSMEGLFHRARYPLVCADSVHLDSSGMLTFDIQENRVASVRVEGQKRTRPSFILGSLPEMKGKPLSSKELASGVNSLYATGLFSSVSAQTTRTASGPEVSLKVEEQHFTRLRFGAHWYEQFRAEAFAELADVNLFGMGHHAALYGMYGDLRYHLEASVGADRLASTYLTYSVRVYHRHEEWPLYVLSTELPYSLLFERTGGRLSVGQQIRRFGLVFVGLRAEDVDDYVEPGLKFTPWHLRTVFVQADLDTFDRFPLPRSGYRQRIVLEQALEAFGGNTQFTKFSLDLEAVLPLGREHVALLGGALGTSDAWLPESERYILGGRTTFFGLHTGEGRGDYFWRGHVALRMHNGGTRYITLQYNLGNIWTYNAEVDVFDVIHGVGAAYTLDSPLGPLDLGAGISTDRSVVWYLNLGLPW